MPVLTLRQSGHFDNAKAQFEQQTKCPHGRKMVVISASRHTLQVSAAVCEEEPAMRR